MKWPQLPDYGYMDRWPQDGVGFIHPSDVAVARTCIPSHRVFRRDEFDGEYYSCVYGDTRFRLKPCLWQPVRSEGYDIGDLVQTIGLGMSRERFVGHVVGIEFEPYRQTLLYYLSRGKLWLPNRFRSSELRLLTDKSKVRPRAPTLRIPAWMGDSYVLKNLAEQDRGDR